MNRIEHASYYLGDLLAEMQSGQLVLPRFQRPFVWQDSDVLLLLDSLAQGYPVGALILWGGWWRAANVAPERCRSFAGCAPPQGHTTLVLDGQQRLQSLLLASQPEGRFVWDAATGVFAVGEAAPERGVFPVRWLLDRNARDVWDGLHAVHSLAHPVEWVDAPAPPKRRGKGAAPSTPQKEARHLPQTPEQQVLAERLTRLFALQQSFASVRLGSLLIPPDATLAFAREVFRRLNTTGRPMSEADVFDALQREES